MKDGSGNLFPSRTDPVVSPLPSHADPLPTPGSRRLSAPLSHGSTVGSNGRGGFGDLFPSRTDPVVLPYGDDGDGLTSADPAPPSAAAELPTTASHATSCSSSLHPEVHSSFSPRGTTPPDLPQAAPAPPSSIGKHHVPARAGNSSAVTIPTLRHEYTCGTLLDMPLVLHLVRGFLKDSARVARLVDAYLAEARSRLGCGQPSLSRVPLRGAHQRPTSLIRRQF